MDVRWCLRGGVKGIGLVGALDILGKQYTFPRVAGTSAGAITAALLAAGMPTDQIHNVLFAMDFRKFMDRTVVGRIPVVGPVAGVVAHEGVFAGDYFHRWISHLLATCDPPVRTFKDRAIPARS